MDSASLWAFIYPSRPYNKQGIKYRGSEADILSWKVFWCPDSKLDNEIILLLLLLLLLVCALGQYSKIEKNIRQIKLPQVLLQYQVKLPPLRYLSQQKPSLTLLLYSTIYPHHGNRYISLVTFLKFPPYVCIQCIPMQKTTIKKKKKWKWK